MLNSEQQRAICHREGPAMVLAGPGSGKTFVITRRIQYLIDGCGIEPSHILVITFSKASAYEMQKRFSSLMQDTYYPVTFGTFHAIFFQMISQIYHYHVSDIMTLPQKKKILRTAYYDVLKKEIADNEYLTHFLQKIARYKNSGETGILPDDLFVSNEEFLKIYLNYNRELRAAKKIDFEDMLLLCKEMLLKNPEIAAYFAEKYKYILIDEYQDINEVSYEIIKKLSYPRNNLFVVGDDDQSIYSFRGASPKSMMQFEKDFPNCQKYFLNINYRSTGKIVEFASRVICKNTIRYPKDIKAAGEVGNPVVVKGFETQEKEYEFLTEALKKKQEKNKLEECACLFRTNREASRFAEWLMKEKVMFCMKEPVYNPYGHFIFRDFIHYLNLAQGSLKTEDFLAVMNRPVRYFSRKAVSTKELSMEKLSSYYRDKPYMLQHIHKMQYDLLKLKKMDLFSSVNYIRKAIGYDTYLRQVSIENHVAYEEYQNIADELQERMKQFKNKEELLEYVEKINLQEWKNKEKRSKEKGVNIMTFHGSKGLEFETVYLPDCNQGIIPHKKSTDKMQIEEERRMFYVALTRAKKELIICFLNGEKDKHKIPSEFLKEEL